MTYFEIHELVCPDVYKKFNEKAWTFFDPRLLTNLETIRRKIGKPIIINTWKDGGKFDERGLRCLLCPIVKEKYNSLYLSAHMTGQAIDFDVEGLVAEEVRQWLIKIKGQLPYAVRLEDSVSWVHLDTRNNTNDQVILFKA